jgi:Holliday junction DNA helicase RuvA
MIALLRGRLLEKSPSRLIVDVGGVGYDVQVPASTFFETAEPGADVLLRVHTHVREDQISLYGFGTTLELQLFEHLIAVNGIGPKLALGVLSGIEPRDLIRAVRTADVGRLTRIPGIGKKTAERVTLELKDKLGATTYDAAAPSAAPVPATSDALKTDVLSALVNLGYQRAAAEKAVDAAMSASTAPTVEGVLRHALRALAR